MNNFHLKQKDIVYQNSKEWLCENSPTKAHIWNFQPPQIKSGILVNIGKCKICSKEKIIVIKDRD